jgi:hypothetical protein
MPDEKDKYIPWMDAPKESLVDFAIADEDVDELMSIDGPIRPDQMVDDRLPTQTHGGGPPKVIRYKSDRKRTWRRDV